MTDEHPPHAEPVRLSEDAAHRLMARAIELDHARGSETTAAELRAIALEAGISGQAFDAAVREFRAQPPSKRSDARQSPAPSRSFSSNLWRLLRGSRASAPTFGDELVSNAIVAALFWVIVFVLTRLAGEIGWQAMEAAILISFMLGVGIARRLRTRVLEIGFMGMVAFQATELALHLALGIRAVQGAPTHLAIMIAGMLGAIAWSRRHPRDDTPMPAEESSTVESLVDSLDSSVAPGADSPSRPRLDTQRLRPEAV